MPNWVEGKLKIRGDKKNIKKILKYKEQVINTDLNSQEKDTT